MKKVKNDNVLKLYNWMRFLDPSEAHPLVTSLNSDGLWECSYYLPKIDKILTNANEDSYKAQCEIADEACKLIDQYLFEHPDFKIKTEIGPDTHEVVKMEDGTLVPLPKLETRNAYGEKIREQREMVQKFIKEYRERFCDEFYGMFFQVVTNRAIPLEVSGTEISRALANNVLDMYGTDASKIDVVMEEDMVVVWAKIVDQKMGE